MMSDNVVSFKPRSANIIYNAEDPQSYFFILDFFLELQTRLSTLKCQLGISLKES